MADPFQDVDAAGPDFIKAFADSMDHRQSDPTMEKIVSAYLDQLSFPAEGLTIEIGAGAGAVSRRIAARAEPARVLGFEPSEGFVAEAKNRAAGIENLSFQVADGASLPLEDGAVHNAVLHTVLTHVTAPETLVAEAFRVLAPGGHLVICDADFSKSSLASFDGDPLDACAKVFVKEFVTDAHIVSKIRPLLKDAGFEVGDFTLHSRLVADGEQMLAWVVETGKVMVRRGEIGQPLADALADEYRRRLADGSLYGYQVFATAIARKPDAPR